MERLGDPSAWSEHLPPRDAWLFKPGTDEKIPMPINDRGLVQIDKMVQIILSTIDPTYQWKLNGFHDLHHLYFPKVKYPNRKGKLFNPAVFRNLTSNKVLMSREMHEVAHTVLAEAPMPSEETMFYRNETQRVTIALMDSGEVSDRMKIVEKYDKNKLKSLQSSQLEHFLFHLEALREIPEEYRYIDPPETTPQTVEDMYNLRRDLGRTAINVTNLIRLSEIGQVAA